MLVQPLCVLLTLDQLAQFCLPVRIQRLHSAPAAFGLHLLLLMVLVVVVVVVVVPLGSDLGGRRGGP